MGLLRKMNKEKQQIRIVYRKKLAALSEKRRTEAAKKLYSLLLPSVKGFDFVLSFTSLPKEINLSLFNLFLEKQNKLLLPNVIECETKSENTLEIYRVTDQKHQLVSHPRLKIFQPNTKICQKIENESAKCVIVPALAFDGDHYRIGYGGGYYDHFLTGLSEVLTIGVGFEEQFSSTPLPREDHDLPLKKLLLV